MLMEGQITPPDLPEQFFSQLLPAFRASAIADLRIANALLTPTPIAATENQRPEFSQAIESPRQRNQGKALRPPVPFEEMTAPVTAVPRSGSQLFAQRMSAIKAGKLYTRLPASSFHSVWSQATRQPTYEQWRGLLKLEAKAVARGQGNNRLSIMVGDSLSLWYPTERLPQGQLWLNQGISGDTTQGILNRLSTFSQTRPDTIYIMAGINDLRRGVSDRTVLTNLQQIMRRLRQSHPQANLVVQSILPTDGTRVANDRINRINQQLSEIAFEEGVAYLDVHSYFTDDNGRLKQALTTDGLHLSAMGYANWQWVLWQADGLLARR